MYEFDPYLMGSLTKDDVLSGKRVEVIYWAVHNEDGTPTYVDDNNNVPPGTRGTIQDVDDAGTIHVKWDNGRTIGLVPPADKFMIFLSDQDIGQMSAAVLDALNALYEVKHVEELQEDLPDDEDSAWYRR